MLHGVPSVKTSTSVGVHSGDTLRRRGYESLATEAPDEVGSRYDEELIGSSHGIPSSRDTIVKSGWKVLGWSFITSGAMSVIQQFVCCPLLNTNTIHVLALRILFSVHICYPDLWFLPCNRVALGVFS